MFSLSGVGRGDGLLIAVAVGVLIIASILIHELAHAVVGLLLGAKVERIVLSVIGGVCIFRSKVTSNWRDFLISVSGPASNFALWYIFDLSLQQTLKQTGPSTWAYVCLFVSEVNLLLGIFNLLPGFPLDGGQALRSLVLLVTRRELWAAWTVAVTGCGVGAFLGWRIFEEVQNPPVSFINIIFLGILAYWIVSASIGQLQATQGLTGNALRYKRDPQKPETQKTLPQEGVVAGGIVNRIFDGSYEPRTSVAEFLVRSTNIGDQALLPVLRDGYFAGAITRTMARRVSKGEQENTILERVMIPRREFQSVYEDDDISIARLMLRAGRGRPVLVLDRGGAFVGFISGAELEKVRR